MAWLSRFNSRTFLLLYAHRFLFGWASAAALSFEYAYLLRHNTPITVILLFIASVFFVSGTVALCSVSLQQRLKIPTVFMIAMICSVIASIMVAQASWSLPLALSSALFSGSAMGLYYPASDVLEAIYVTDNRRRGRQYTFGISCTILGTAIGAALNGVLIAHFGYLVSAFTSMLVYMMSLVPVYQLPPHAHGKTKPLSPPKVLHYMGSPAFRSFWLLFFGQQLCIIIKLLIPAYLFLVLGGFQETGFVIAGSTILQVILLTLSGNSLDRHGHAIGVRNAAWLYATSFLGFILVPVSAGTALFLNTTNMTTAMLMDGALITRLHSLLRRHPMPPFLLFGTAWQIALCSGEVLTLLCMSALTTYVGNGIFSVLFLGGVIGSLIQYYGFPRKTNV